MLRKIHSLLGPVFALLLVVTAASGAFLAYDAAQEGLSAPQGAQASLPVRALAAKVVERFAEVEKITQTPSGALRVLYAENGAPKAAIIDPVTAQPLGMASVSPFWRFVTNLHRAWLAGEAGRVVVGVSALAMVLLVTSGLVLLKRQAGGWLRLFRPLAFSGSRRWHLALGRYAALGLLLSSLTGVYLSLTGFEILPDGASAHEGVVSGSGGARRAIADLAGLEGITLGQLRELTFPYAGDATDPITLKTDQSLRYIDAATGEVLRDEPHVLAFRVQDLVWRLHTGQGMLWLAIPLGLSAVAGSVLSLAGILIWWSKRRRTGAIAKNARADQASILLLVGSEGQTTWGFARALHRALSAAGHAVHTAAMNDLPEQAPLARHMLILCATAGNGEAPASASRFLDKLDHWRGTRPEAIVLGFGDRQFEHFCAYADAVESALLARGFSGDAGLSGVRIDRQSGAAFLAFGSALAKHLGTPLSLSIEPNTQKTYRFELVEREDYGAEVQAPTTILRFAPVPRLRWLPQAMQRALGFMPRFEAGDLVNISPPGEHRLRAYSLASSAHSGILEFCVRKVPGGACSSFLHGLGVGDRLDASIRANPAFRPDASDNPLILIGAGAGIAPLVGFIRAQNGRRPVHLYWGGRNPASDFLYREELEAHVLEGRIASLRTAFSRLKQGAYVQNLLEADHAELGAAIETGAQVLVCGGRGMAEGVRGALSAIIAPLGLDLPALRQSGRLIEDVY